MAEITKRLAHAWNAFTNRSADDIANGDWSYGQSYGSRPDRVRLRMANERSIISSIYTRLSIDVASVEIRHVRLDDNDRYSSDMDTSFNECLTVEANIDQAARHFRQDIAWSLFNNGCIAVVPIDYSGDPMLAGFDIKTMRVGNVVSWYPQHVRVDVFNEATGRREEITVPKRITAIVENPLYSVMNEPNSTLQRLIRKLHLLDAVDEQSSSGKLDLIIQLPYVVKSELGKNRANKRRGEIEDQLKGSKYGIAYTDGTEKITQLNRPAENNLWQQIQDLTTMLYGELGLTPEIMNGTADEKTMLNYINRTIEPVLGAIAGEMKRKFLTKTARTQKQSVEYFRDPFKLVPMSDLAEMVDKFTRNEVFSSNEIRTFLGVKPSSDPRADKLLNSNMAPNPEAMAALPSSDAATANTATSTDPAPDSSELVDTTFNGVDDQLSKMIESLGGDPNADA